LAKNKKVMATITNNPLINGLHGKFGRAMVFRTMRGKTFLSALGRKPDKEKESAAQRNTRTTFRDATQWARNILHDPEKKKYYQQRAKALGLPNAYTAALTDYMRKPNVVKTQRRNTITYSISKRGFAVRHVQTVVNETTEAAPQKVVTKQENGHWLVHYTSDVGTSSPITLIITDNALREIRFVDVPI
jgi:hypothetical protein